MDKYDLIVIGNGSAGDNIARTLGRKGKRVAVVEREHLGGECLNDGCIPSKALIALSKRAEREGWAPADPAHAPAAMPGRGLPHPSAAGVTAGSSLADLRVGRGSGRSPARRPLYDGEVEHGHSPHPHGLGHGVAAVRGWGRIHTPRAPLSVDPVSNSARPTAPIRRHHAPNAAR